MGSVERLLLERLAPAFAAVAGEPSSPSMRRSRYGDFPADGALAIAHHLGTDPTAIAEQLGPTGRVGITEAAEHALAVDLLEFAPVVAGLEQSLAFHKLASYLHGLAVAFTAFYEQCPVLRAEGPVRESRLQLGALTARTLARGLSLLGIAAVERM